MSKWVPDCNGSLSVVRFVVLRTNIFHTNAHWKGRRSSDSGRTENVLNAYAYLEASR